MKYIILAAVAIISYLIGSISSAILVGRILSGDDIRNHGSGNAGATNALRTYGKAAAAYVTAGDCLKSAVSCLIGIAAAHLTPLGADNANLAIYAAGIGAVLGHNFPLYFGFKGGKGILVSITALMFADWRIALVIFIISIVIMIVTRYVSLGSVLGAVLFMICALIFKHNDPAYCIFTFVLGLLAIYKHRANISRLIHGTESKVGSKK